MTRHEDKTLFRQAVAATAQRRGIPDTFIEKDNWIPPSTATKSAKRSSSKPRTSRNTNGTNDRAASNDSLFYRNTYGMD